MRGKSGGSGFVRNLLGMVRVTRNPEREGFAGAGLWFVPAGAVVVVGRKVCWGVGRGCEGPAGCGGTARRSATEARAAAMSWEEALKPSNSAAALKKDWPVVRWPCPDVCGAVEAACKPCCAGGGPR